MLPIPANGTAMLAGDGAHLRLPGMQKRLQEGQLVPIVLEFSRSGQK